ncbi:PTPA-CTERM sorting domain-containing protein [Pantanalinema rosaneae CENA516]|uniref:PTPA-CTERM sorting domain-containing protein n=1 Tax=Pantanalinema rosaneae TaxID=1620701 RepID=UPI003D6E8F91
MNFKSLSAGAVIAGMITTGTLATAPAQAACLGNGDCTSVSLFDAIHTGGFSYQVGDKIFDNFRNYTTAESGGGDAPTDKEISFTGFKHSDTAYYLKFESSKWNVDAGETISTSWFYDITSLAAPINGIDIALADFSFTSGQPGTKPGQIHINETAYLPPYDSVGPNTALANLGVDTAQGVVGGVVYFSPLQKITIAKGVDLEGHGGTASLSAFNNSVRQVPTPALLPGLIGMGVAAWRKRKGEVADEVGAEG